MNEAQRLELQQIRAEQRFLTARLAGLEQRLARFEAADKLAVEPIPAAAVPPPLPPRVPPVALPSPVPTILADTPVTVPPRAAAGAEPAPAREVNPPPAGESLEMRIGGTWLVRVGIVLFLTFLAFLGSYLYENVVPHLGPAAKVGLLYLGAGTVAGLGAWLERSRPARESGRLRQYARIVLAGGLAAVYYVTYVAHFYERLRVVPSPLLAGVLLLAWAAFMVWLAERRGSETLATVAILLAYYTAAINEGVAGFTLASNLFLSAGAVFLLRRHLWRVFSVRQPARLLRLLRLLELFPFVPRLAGAGHAAGPRRERRKVLDRSRLPVRLLAAVHLGGVHGARRSAAADAAGGVRQPEQRRVLPADDLAAARGISARFLAVVTGFRRGAARAGRDGAPAAPAARREHGGSVPRPGRAAGDARLRHLFQRLATEPRAGGAERGAAGGSRVAAEPAAARGSLRAWGCCHSCGPCTGWRSRARWGRGRWR